MTRPENWCLTIDLELLLEGGQLHAKCKRSLRLLGNDIEAISNN